MPLFQDGMSLKSLSILQITTSHDPLWSVMFEIIVSNILSVNWTLQEKGATQRNNGGDPFKQKKKDKVGNRARTSSKESSTFYPMSLLVHICLAGICHHSCRIK